MFQDSALGAMVACLPCLLNDPVVSKARCQGYHQRGHYLLNVMCPLYLLAGKIYGNRCLPSARTECLSFRCCPCTSSLSTLKQLYSILTSRIIGMLLFSFNAIMEGPGLRPMTKSRELAHSEIKYKVRSTPGTIVWPSMTTMQRFGYACCFKILQYSLESGFG